MAINAATDFSRLQRDSEAPAAARSGFDASSLRTRDFARVLQDQAAERAATASAAVRSAESASARPSSDAGDAKPASPPQPQSAAPSAGLRVDVEQRNAAVRQAQQGLQQASRERADLAAHRAEATRADTARAASSSPAARKPALSESHDASAVKHRSADAQQSAHDAPATMAAWLRNAVRANRADPASGRGEPITTALASEDVPPRSEDTLLVASAWGLGAAALDPATALATGGALPAGLPGAASSASGNSVRPDSVAGSGAAAQRGAKAAAGLGADGSDPGSASAGSLRGKGRNGTPEAGLTDRTLGGGAPVVQAALPDRLANLGAGGDGTASGGAGDLAAAARQWQGRVGGEAESGVRSPDFGAMLATPAWDMRSAVDGVKSADPVAASFPISTPVQDEGFGEHVSLTVGSLARQGFESATLQLNPADMGPVAVSIALAGDQARVNFTADRDDTCKALEASLSQLDAALRADGLVLVEAQVAPTAPASNAGGADTGTANGQGYPQGGAADGGRQGAGTGSGEPRNRWAAAGMSPAARAWDLQVDAADGSILTSSPRTSGTGQLDLYA